MECTEKHTSFGGTQEVWRHRSVSLDVEVSFAIYLPPQAKEQKVPVLYWLSGRNHPTTDAGVVRRRWYYGALLQNLG